MRVFMDPLRLVAAIEDGRWAPGIGDPSLVGWAVVLGYLLAAAFCVLWARPPGPGRRLPLAIASLMLLLACNKQLDLQSLFTQIARDVLKSEGWYQDRRELQVLFIVTVAVTMALALAAAVWIQRHRWQESGLALLGLICLSGFILVRAASFHNVDHGLSQAVGGLKLNAVLELGGIAMVLGGAIVGWFSRRSKVVGVSSSLARDPADSPGTSGTPQHEVESSSGPVRSAAIAGFVVRPIRISPGPGSRSRGADSPMSPSGVPL
jgi:hypothetical protein